VSSDTDRTAAVTTIPTMLQNAATRIRLRAGGLLSKPECEKDDVCLAMMNSLRK
jgi:hypothetical protein